MTVQAKWAGGWRASAAAAAALESIETIGRVAKDQSRVVLGLSATARPGPRRWHRRHGWST